MIWILFNNIVWELHTSFMLRQTFPLLFYRVRVQYARTNYGLYGISYTCTSLSFLAIGYSSICQFSWSLSRRSFHTLHFITADPKRQPGWTRGFYKFRIQLIVLGEDIVLVLSTFPFLLLSRTYCSVQKV